jgi:hypothetical protein
VATYKASEPNTGPVVGVGENGEVVSFKFDKDGYCEVPDDFQEAHVILATARGVKRVKAKEKGE